jgi:nicotinamide-nucleotide amidase
LTGGRPRAWIVVTGSELVRGDRTDRNGPFLAKAALGLGLEPVRIAIVGDDPGQLRAAVEAGLEADLCLFSGGLGPTHDDRTVETVAAALGLLLEVDESLLEEIGGISRRFAERLRRPYADFEAGVRKQATVPRGAIVLGLAGTAPGLLLEHGEGRVAVILPGPPPELQRLWPAAVETDPFRRLVARTRRPECRLFRFFGVSESSVAQALADAGGDGEGVEATICAHDFEIHIDLLVEPGAGGRADDLERRLLPPVERHLFARDERPVEELVLAHARSRGTTLATAESCTGGLVSARLTSVPGSSDAFVGGVVAYANEAKERELGVPRATLERHGAVSAETAAAMAEGARKRLGADVAVSVTGVAGPGGGTPEKPVGLVHVHVSGPGDAQEGRTLELPGDRSAIRARATATALHLLRRALEP